MQTTISIQKKGYSTSWSGRHFSRILTDASGTRLSRIFGLNHHLARLGTCLIATIISYTSAYAEDINVFRNTGIESYLELRYLFDERMDTNAGVETLSQQQTTTEQELSFLTHNYVYHPNLLKLDLGAGFTFVQDSFETASGESDGEDGLYSLYARASFLEKKPYPLALYYNRDNPASFPGRAERVQQTNTLYGFDFALLEPLIPLKVNMFASHNERTGDSLTQVVDETIDRFGIRASKSYDGNYSHSLGYDHTEEDSSTGSLLVPGGITPTSRTTDVVTYNSDWVFGQADQFRYFDRATYTQEEGVLMREEINFYPTLLWRYSDKLHSSYRYGFLDSSINDVDTTNHNASANLDYLYSDQTEFNAGVTAEDNQTTGVTNRLYGIDGRVQHKRPVPNGKLTLTAVAGYQQIDRESEADDTLARVIGERVTLTGLTPVALANDFIDITTIEVENLAQTQTYVENTDYRVIVVGARTEIQRLGGSNIGDPETVRVNYSYKTGGSAGYTNLDQTYRAALEYFRYYNFYVQYRLADQEVTSGAPTTPLNNQRGLSYGASVDYPVNDWLEVGASVDITQQDEDISSFSSQRYDAYSQFLLPLASTLRVSANRLTVDNDNTDEDIDLTGYSVILRSRPINRMIVSAEAYTEEDVGGTQFRKRDTFRLSAQWQLYRLRVDAQAILRKEQTGPAETERTQFLATIRRDF